MSNNNPTTNNHKVNNPEIKSNGVKVSVIMPIYNGEKILDEYLPQVLNQSLKEVNFFLVNDGSKDKTLEILKKYEKKDSRITVLTQENGGAGSARNLGLNYLKDHPELQGKYLWFPDLGDDFDPDFLTKMWINAQLNQSDLVLSNHFMKLSNQDYLRYKDSKYKLFTFDYPFSIETTDFKNFFKFEQPAPWNKIFSTEIIFQNNLLFDQHFIANDATFVLLNYCLAQRISYLDETMIYYNTSSFQLQNDIQKNFWEKENSFLISLDKNSEPKKEKNYPSITSKISKSFPEAFRFFESSKNQMKELGIWQKGKNLLQTRFACTTTYNFFFIKPESYPEFFELFDFYRQKLEIPENYVQWGKDNDALSNDQRNVLEIANEFLSKTTKNSPSK